MICSLLCTSELFKISNTDTIETQTGHIGLYIQVRETQFQLNELYHLHI